MSSLLLGPLACESAVTQIVPPHVVQVILSPLLCSHTDALRASSRTHTHTVTFVVRSHSSLTHTWYPVSILFLLWTMCCHCTVSSCNYPLSHNDMHPPVSLTGDVSLHPIHLCACSRLCVRACTRTCVLGDSSLQMLCAGVPRSLGGWISHLHIHDPVCAHHRWDP